MRIGSILFILWTLGQSAIAAPICPTRVGRLIGRSGARALGELTALKTAETCGLSADDRAVVDGFRPRAGTPERVADGIEDLRFDRPRFKAVGWNESLTCAAQNTVLTCAERYGDAMKSLENAVAYAAIKDPMVAKMAQRLAKRLVSIARARATKDVLGDRRQSPTAQERERIERAVDAKLVKAFATCTPEQADCLSLACPATGGGDCAAAQARHLRGALGGGNLRETMFFLYTSNGILTENASRPVKKGEDHAAVARENAANVDAINARLRASGEDWALTNLPIDYESPFIIARTGYGADNNGMRDWRRLNDGTTGCVAETKRIGDAPVPSLAMIPLSARESDVLAKRLKVDPARLSEQPLPSRSGESCFALKQNIEDSHYAKYNALLQNTRAAKIPMLTGVSGTTDSLMGLGRALGLHSREDFELLRAAALGWLVSSRDHSVHEVMTAASSFKELPPYHFRPDAYKTMLPHRPGFAKDVEAYQRAHGQPLPGELLNSCLTTREASR